MGIGSFLREERRKKKMTLRELAIKANVDFSMLSKYENGIVNPPQKKLQRILAALDVPEDTVLNRTQLENTNNTFLRRHVISEIDEDRLYICRSSAEHFVIDMANGRCELCGQIFPQGELFLEAHHVIWLSKGGTPTLDNTVALCPNCHKMIHLTDDPATEEKLLSIAKTHV